ETQAPQAETREPRTERGRQPRAERGRDREPREERSREPRQESREEPTREPRQPQRPQRILLPGESLAKYNPRAEAAAAGEKKNEPVAESRFNKVAPRPSTEFSVAPGSLSAGVLAGESLAKYRNRPAPTEPPQE